MFQSARLKLTAWYLLIIMLVSGTFSIAFYRASTYEIQRVIDRIHYLQSQSNQLMLPTPPTAIITLDQLQDVKTRLQIALLIVNGIIFVIAGGAGYFLAGRTLKPIQIMVDEQNQFVSDASHELRTPIATLRAEMEATLLESHLGDKEARALVESNLEELGKLQELANSLLQLAYRSDKTSVPADEVSLDDIIKNAYKKVAPMAKKKHITFTISRISGKIHAEKNSLIEVFVNLFDNAIKYSPNDTEVIVNSTNKKHSSIITVKDHGMGISEKDLPHIFDRFYRADKSRTGTDGHGLGLSIVKKIVTAYNGSITVNSTLDKGTTFILTFPRSS
ncbi:MAG TPA: HAMP domain-containing sensor histidine kinase [Candidatus Saccharimonadales bacterium]|nr:HAMP domain-containing sensor histidine kinase [Candidatus Saccharimonadales bacterium]